MESSKSRAGSGPVWLDGMNTESRGLRKGVSGTSGKVSVSRRGSSREVNTDFYSREMVLASVERQTHTEVKGLRDSCKGGSCILYWRVHKGIDGEINSTVDVGHRPLEATRMASPWLDEGQTGLYSCAQQSEQTTTANLHPRAPPTILLVDEPLCSHCGPLS